MVDNSQSIHHSRQKQRELWLKLPQLLVSQRWRWITVGVVLLALVLLRLGWWQLDRLNQRQALNQVLAERLAVEPVPLTGQSVNVETDEYRRFIVQGEYDYTHEVVLRNRTRAEIPGVEVLTPLRIAGSDQSVLINRGWLPLQQATQEARQRLNQPGQVTVEGILRKPQTRIGTLSPQDLQPAGGRLEAWFRPDVARIANQVPYALLPFYLEQVAEPNATVLPRPQPIEALETGPHLSYAIQWFSFCAILLGGYAALVVTRSQELEKIQKAQTTNS